MVKSSSIVLVGTGIFVMSLYTALIAYHSIAFSGDYSLAYQIMSLSQNAGLENIEKNIDGLTAIVELVLGIAGMGLGILLLLIGGAKLVNEKRKPQNIEEQKPVSLIWQVIGSAFPGFDLLVMYRIKKLRYGSIVYASQFVIATITYLSDLSVDVNTIIGLLVGIGYAVVVYIWSKKWNEQFLENSIGKETK